MSKTLTIVATIYDEYSNLLEQILRDNPAQMRIYPFDTEDEWDGPNVHEEYFQLELRPNVLEVRCDKDSKERRLLVWSERLVPLLQHESRLRRMVQSLGGTRYRNLPFVEPAETITVVK